MKSENRIGRFKLDHSLLKRWEDQLHIMGNFVVVRAESWYSLQAIDYIAFSPLFEVWPEDQPAPEYELEIALMPDGPAVIKAHRVMPPSRAGNGQVGRESRVTSDK